MGKELSDRQKIDKAKEIAYPLLKEREGVRYVVYKDSLGYPTGGMGHLIRKGEPYEVGDRIPKEVVEQWAKEDMETAAIKGMLQAYELGKGNDIEFMAALLNVNFQLGDFKRKFKNTFEMLKNGEVERVIQILEASLWAQQTPKRVRDFIAAIRKAYK